MRCKRIVALLLVSCLLIGSVPAASATELDVSSNVHSFTVGLNTEATRGVVQNPSEEIVAFTESRSDHNIDVRLSTQEDGSYVAEGHISIARGTFHYSASGVLTEVGVQEWNGIIGVLSGELSDGTSLGISVHSIPDQNKLFLFVSVGNATDENGDETYVFGDVFNEMDYLVERYLCQLPMGDPLGVSNITSDDGIVTFASASDYNTTYRGKTVGQGTTLDGVKYDLCVASFYTPKRVGPNESAKAYVKVNGHTGNAAAYAAGKYVIPGAVTTTILGGTCRFGSLSDLKVELTHLDPQDESFNVSLPIPYYTVANGFGTLPWSFNIGINTIKTELTRHTGSIVDNTAEWSHNYSKDVSWNSSDPVATQLGYSGCATLTYHNNEDKAVSFSMVAGGSIQYQYSSYVLGKNYVGNFTAYAGAVTVSITCDARNT